MQNMQNIYIAYSLCYAYSALSESWCFPTRDAQNRTLLDTLHLKNPTPHRAIFVVTPLIGHTVHWRQMYNIGMKTHQRAYVSVLEENKGHLRSGHIWHILIILYIQNILHSVHNSVWLLHSLVGREQVHHRIWVPWIGTRRVFKCPPCWGSCLLFQWVRPGLYCRRASFQV